MKQVFVIYDPLYERPVCVHNRKGIQCPQCDKEEYHDRNSYHLIEQNHIVYDKDDEITHNLVRCNYCDIQVPSFMAIDIWMKDGNDYYCSKCKQDFI